MSKRNAKTKPYWEMNAEELAAATAEFDREFVIDTFGPPPPAARERLARARRKRGRPRPGVISLSIEKGLLRRADVAAKKRGISRAEWVARCRLPASA